MRKHLIALGLAALALTYPAVGANAADRPVADAAARGGIETVRGLLRGGADVNMAQGDGMTALHWAADRGDVELGRLLIYAGGNVNVGTRIGRYTPLHIAARRGHAGIMKVLLEAKANPNAATTNSGVLPLHLAAASGNIAAVTALLEAGADIDAAEGAWGQTPLIFAAAAGRVEVIETLLKAGADPAITAWVVDVVDREKADRAAEKRLTQFLADFKDKAGGGTGWRPSPSQVQAALDVSREIQRKWPDVPDPADDKKADDEAGDEDDDADKTVSTDDAEEPAATTDTVMYNADGEPVGDTKVSAGKPASPATTVAYNADAEPVDDDDAETEEDKPKPPSYGELVGSWGGLTPLLHAVRQGHAEASLTLLEGGADINQASAGDQTTPLLMAAVNGHFDLALTLLGKGADPNLTSAAGTTALFAVLERTWASKASYAHPIEHQQQKATHLDVMKALLEAGAEPNIRLAKHLWYTEYTFSVLRRAGIHLQGATPFWRAAQALDVDAMRLLKDYGADPNIPTVKLPERRRDSDDDEEDEEADKKKTATGETDVAQAEVVAEEDYNEVDDDGEDEDDKDHSGIPEVEIGGPFIYPIHAAAGAGYGQYFAGNAHRHVPENWLAAVRFLIEECGAEVNLRDANAYTALHHAASRGDNELIEYLIAKGADVTVVSRKGQTTADMANGPIQRVSPFPSTIALLEGLGAENNDKCVSC